MKVKKLPNIVVIGIFTLVTALIWGASDLFRSLSKKPETKVSDEVLEPIDPTLDQETLGKIQNTLFFDAGQIPNLPSPSPSPEAASPSPTEAPSTSASASASASVVPTNTASPSPTPTP